MTKQIKKLKPSFTPLFKYKNEHFGTLWVNVKNEHGERELRQLVHGNVTSKVFGEVQ